MPSFFLPQLGRIPWLTAAGYPMQRPRACLQCGGQGFGQTPADVSPAADHFPDGFDQFSRRIFFG